MKNNLFITYNSSESINLLEKEMDFQHFDKDKEIATSIIKMLKIQKSMKFEYRINLFNQLLKIVHKIVPEIVSSSIMTIDDDIHVVLEVDLHIYFDRETKTIHYEQLGIDVTTDDMKIFYEEESDGLPILYHRNNKYESVGYMVLLDENGNLSPTINDEEILSNYIINFSHQPKIPIIPVRDENQKLIYFLYDKDFVI